jgi:glyoxylase-like metal-dependent hydrolase (beta-lactamase superfamily II)
MVFKQGTRKAVAHARAAEHMRQPPGRPAPTTEQFYPTETFTETWRATVGDEVIRAKHHGPAHSGGDIVVTFERANVVHMGDLMFKERHPVVDRPAGASLKNWAALLDNVVDEHDSNTVFIFGHAGGGAPVTGGAADLTMMRDYLSYLLEHVAAARKAGRTREQIVAETAPLPKYAGYGPVNGGVLGAVYDEVAAG